MRTDLDAVEELWRQLMAGRAPLLSWSDASMIANRIVSLERDLAAARKDNRASLARRRR